MGRIGKLLSFVRVRRGTAKISDVQVDKGGGENRTWEHFSDAGDDSYPMPGDYVAPGGQSGTGRESAVGYIDPKNAQKALIGEKRIYARDGNGDSVVELWLKNTGEGILSNANGYIKLLANGTVDINGVTIDPSGNTNVPISLILNSRELNDHNHDILGGSSAPGPTGGNNP